MTKIIFGRKALGVPTPLIVKAIFKWIKRVCLAATALSAVNEHEYMSFGFVSVAWFIDEIEPLFGVISENKNEGVDETNPGIQ